MKLFTTEQVRLIDEYTIKNEPVASTDLMERASKAFTLWFIRHFDISHKIVVFAGPGNNGGDALAVSRMLHERNYKLMVYVAHFSSKMSDDCLVNYKRMQQLDSSVVHDLKEGDPLPELSPGMVVIDGLFGSGLNRPVTGFPAKLINFINHSGLKVISIDIPSGLFGEDNRNNNYDAIVKADYTITFQFPFISFLFAENYRFTGEWRVVNIGLHNEIIKKLDSPYSLLTEDVIKSKIRSRPKFSHKGYFGHALLISGSHGMMGAAVIGARACLRGGAGLVTVHVPSCGYQIIQTAVPEALVSVDPSEKIITSVPELLKYSAVGIGPGLSVKADQESFLKVLLSDIKIPFVMDADALNILALHQDWYEALPANTILTPHPGEFDRLVGKSVTMYERYIKQLEFSKQYNVIVVLKAAHTIITLPDGRTFFNTTGNPGMATGGSGDVLTGLILSLLAQSYKPEEASQIGVFIHGLAADLAVKKTGQQALIAGDIVDNLGNAFLSLN